MKKEYKTIKVSFEDGVAVLTIDSPPVNQMSQQMGQDFGEAITEAFGDDAVKAVILTGTGKNFIAGADITQLQRVKTRDEVFQVALRAARFLNSIEVGPKPVIAAINGNCLGGWSGKPPWSATIVLRPRVLTWDSPRCRSDSSRGRGGPRGSPG